MSLGQRAAEILHARREEQEQALLADQAEATAQKEQQLVQERLQYAQCIMHARERFEADVLDAVEQGRSHVVCLVKARDRHDLDPSRIMRSRWIKSHRFTVRRRRRVPIEYLFSRIPNLKRSGYVKPGCLSARYPELVAFINWISEQGLVPVAFTVNEVNVHSKAVYSTEFAVGALIPEPGTEVPLRKGPAIPFVANLDPGPGRWTGTPPKPPSEWEISFFSSP